MALWLDLFASEYKWTIKQTLSHTFYQLKVLSNAVSQRKFSERTLLLNIIRVAQSSDKNDVQKFVNSISPQIDKPVSNTVTASPVGFQSG